MLETIIARKNLRKNLKYLTAALVLSGGTSLGLYYNSMSRIEQEMRIFDSFEKDIITKEVSYHYANGIKAEVIYRKKSGKKSLLLKLLDDPNGLLIDETPKEDSPVGSTYYMELDEENKISYREIHTTLAYEGVDASVEVRIKRVKVGEDYKDNTQVKTKGSMALQGVIDAYFDEVEYSIANKILEIDRILSVDDLVKNLISLKK